MTNQLVEQEKQETQGRKVEFEVNNEIVALSPSIVQQFVTKGNDKISKEEAVNFMMLCKYAKLNPFLNEAYLIKFEGTPAQMIVSKEAFLKRAQRHPKFNGYKAGIVVLRNEDIVKKDGQTLYPNEQLLAGWAEVYRKDIDYPVYVEVSLQEYSTGKSTWRTKPATMIRKVALVNALRETFPEDLGAMYTEEENVNNNHTSQSGMQVEKPKKIVNNLAEEFKQQNAIEEDTKPKVVEEVKPKEVVAVQTELDMVEANRSAYEKEQELKGTREHDVEIDEQ